MECSFDTLTVFPLVRRRRSWVPWAHVEGSAKRCNGPSSVGFNSQAGVDRGSCRALMLITGTAMKCGANRTLKRMGASSSTSFTTSESGASSLSAVFPRIADEGQDRGWYRVPDGATRARCLCHPRGSDLLPRCNPMEKPRQCPVNLRLKGKQDRRQHGHDNSPKKSKIRFYLCNFSAPCAYLLEIFGPLE